MYKSYYPYILGLFSIIATPTTLISGETDSIEAASSIFQPFTGKITGNKVRIRQQPTLDSPIIKELSNGDLVVALGEDEDFYAIQPPTEIKGYIFRTYVLDNVIEGSKVNVRLEPDLNAPIIAQLSSGDHVEGSISALNSKWMEILLPNTARLYIAKEYVDKIGDASLLAKMEKRRKEVDELVDTTYAASQTEMQKSFTEINIQGIVADCNKVINNYSDFPNQVAKAKELLLSVQDTYLQKKIAYLETRNSNQSQIFVQSDAPSVVEVDTEETQTLSKQAEWQPLEIKFYESWATENQGLTEEEFYQNQQQQAITLKGMIEPYIRPIKNKPGDYLLISQATHLPIAYLYSTKVNLQEKMGQETTLHVVERPNNNFAYPAYFVLSVE